MKNKIFLARACTRAVAHAHNVENRPSHNGRQFRTSLCSHTPVYNQHAVRMG